MIIAFPRAETAHPKIGSALRAVREARGFSLDQLAQESGVDAARLSMAQGDRVQLAAAELHALINALHIPLGLLFCPVGDLSNLRRLK